MLLKSPDNSLARIHVVGICRVCQHYHPIDLQPDLFGRAAFDWEWKHRQCEQEKPGSVEFLSPLRVMPKGFDDRVFEAAGEAPWWLDFKPNADIKVAYAAQATFTLTAANLASSTTFVAGRESTAISNASNKYLDYEIGGKVTTGTSPTADREIRLYYYRSFEDAPTYPGVLDGTDSDETIANAYILESSLVLGWATSTANTSDLTYPISRSLTMAQAFGIVPQHFGLFLAHSTAVNLNNTGGNHAFYARGIYQTAT